MNVNDIALTLEKGIGPKTAAMLLAEFHSADQIYNTPPAELARRGLREQLALQIAKKSTHHQAEKELAYLKKHSLTALASTDPQYPPLLREIPDYPHVIYIRGNVNALALRALSMVGTRHASSYGQHMANALVEQLAARVPNLSIVSGLACGIDYHCHHAAIRHNTPTVAVIANTLPEVTPAQNSNLARDIIDHGGAIISEYNSASKQTGDFYLLRNRIIAALAEGTVVVEAPPQSGSLNTAKHALEYNRSVMAVPGRATDPASQGTNNLIRHEKATIVCYGEDIVRALGWDIYVPEIGERPTPPTVPVSDQQASLLKHFTSSDPVKVDTLAQLSGLDLPTLASLLFDLEMAGKIRNTPGNSYIKTTSQS
jgi:DNA processing protein